jgi:uncharacterized protein (DUF983 family)
MRCPRCGKGKLYNGLLKIADRCMVCDLFLDAEDSGDDAAAFVTLIIGGIDVGLALWMVSVFTPPPWVHLVVLSPLIILGRSLLATRWLKATLVALQFRSRSKDYSADAPGAGPHYAHGAGHGFHGPPWKLGGTAPVLEAGPD